MDHIKETKNVYLVQETIRKHSIFQCQHVVSIRGNLIGAFLSTSALFTPRYNLPHSCAWYFRVVVPDLFGTSDSFCRREFFHRPEGGRGMVSGWFKCVTFTVQFISIIFTSFLLLFYFYFDFYYYCISSTSDHRALDPRGWGSLL